MRIELQRTFEEYFQQFEQDEEINGKIKRLILDNIGLQDELIPIVDRFLAIAKKHHYDYSTALGYSMLFYIWYSKDLDKAIAYNEQARKMFQQVPGYEETEGILTVANNAVLAHILKEEYGQAYLEILHAMPMAEKKDRMSYYSAFLNNGAIILSEFGLYGKAIQQVEETLQKRDFIGDSNYIVTIFLLSNLYSAAEKPDKLREVLEKYTPYMQQSELFDTTVFLKFYVQAAILERDQKEAKHSFQKLKQAYDFTRNDMVDNVEVYLTFARYYLFMEDYEKAQHYYQIVLDNMNALLGHKRQIYEELGILYTQMHDEKKAYFYLQEAHSRSNQYVSFIDDMYRHELEDVWEKNRMLSYEVLYQRLLDITAFGKTVASSLTRMQLIDVVKKRLPQMFAYDYSRLLLYDEKKKTFQSLDGTWFPTAENPILQQCVTQGAVITNANIQQGDAICEQMGSLYQNDIRSVLFQPVVYQNQLLALFYFGSRQINYFSHTDQGLLQVLADYVAIALHNIYRFEEALDKSSYDYLTGTFNRSALMQRGEQMLLEAKEKQQSLGALMMDIDDFKNINDTYGHMQGDEVIREVTTIMDSCKQHGMIARFGGEEFILLIQNISREALYQIAEQIRYACETSELILSQTRIRFTISIGGSYVEKVDRSLQEMFEEADQRLYAAKRNGKNCVQM